MVIVLTAPRLKVGDEIRVIAPARSLSIVKAENIEIAKQRLRELGFIVTFAKNARQTDEFYSSSIKERITDITEAVLDPNVKGILAATGGYNCNQLLSHLPYQLIQMSPKPWIGYGDITALTLAIHAKTGLEMYAGPDFALFGMKYGFNYSESYFEKATMADAPFQVIPSETWSNDAWYLNPEERQFYPQNGFRVIQPGTARGKLLAGNLSTWSLLFGTEWMPDLTDSIVFIEDSDAIHSATFDRLLQSLLHQPNADKIKALVIGRFEEASGVTDAGLDYIIQSKEELANIPVVANFHYSHTQPLVTLPIGRTVRVNATDCVEILIG